MEDNDIVALLWERQEPALAHLQDKYSTYLMQITRYADHATYHH